VKLLQAIVSCCEEFSTWIGTSDYLQEDSSLDVQAIGISRQVFAYG